MKRSRFVFAFLLWVVAVPLFAIHVTSVDDVIRLHRGGASPALILQAIEDAPHKIEVTRAELAAMREAGLPEELIAAVLAHAEADPDPAIGGAPFPAVADTVGSDAPAEEAAADDCTTYDPPVFILGGWFIPRWLWDPHWYMPRLYKPAESARTQTGREQTARRPPREARNATETPRIHPAAPQREQRTARAPIEHAVSRPRW